MRYVQAEGKGRPCFAVAQAWHTPTTAVACSLGHQRFMFRTAPLALEEHAVLNLSKEPAEKPGGSCG